MSNPFEHDKYSYGAGHGRMFFAKVVDRNDPEQRGRVKIQILGGYQGEQNKEKSYWANPIFGVTSPMNGGIGGPATGVMNDSVISGFFAADGMPMFYGTIAAANKQDTKDPIGEGRNHDVNKHTRDKGEKKGGDIRFDPDKNDYGTKSVTEFAYREAPNPHGRREPKEAEDDDGESSWSMGGYKYMDV